jgi:dolichol-phosphate mannosyltransferase
MAENDDVCVVVPTFNEAETVGDVVSGYRAEGYGNVLVVDGGSTDGTRDVAAEEGARVRVQSGEGKGQAVREALEYVDAPYVLMADGDLTYRPDEADRMLEPLRAGRAQHVVGNRFANMQSGAMSRLNRFGNGVINRAFGLIHGRDLVDILSGYRAFTLSSVRSFVLTEDGFGIETEMSVECVKHAVPVAVVPITYQPRPDASETNLRPFRDGAVIITTLYQMAKTSNPLFYFGSVGILSTLFGVLLGAYVAVEWVTRGISHEVIAVVGGIAILFGVQLLMFGALSDLIVTINREQTRQFERLTAELGDEARPRDGPATGSVASGDVESDRTAETGRDGAFDEEVAESGSPDAHGPEAGRGSRER